MSKHFIELAETTADASGDDSFRIQVKPTYSNRYAVEPYTGEGFVVFVHNKSFKPVYEDGVFVKQGEFNAIKI